MSPCQGEGHGFESRCPLSKNASNSVLLAAVLQGDVAKWQGTGLQNPYHGFKSHRRLSQSTILNHFMGSNPRKGTVSDRRLSQSIIPIHFMGSNPRKGAVSDRRLFQSIIPIHFMGSNPRKGAASHRRLSMGKLILNLTD